MKKLLICNFQFLTPRGFSLVEVILAVGIFFIFASGAVGVAIQGFSSNRLSEEVTIANQFASEGLEAARSIKNQDFDYLVNSNGTGVMPATNTYYYNSLNASSGWNSTGNMLDGSMSTFSNSNTNGAYVHLDANEYFSGESGQVTRVEVRAYIRNNWTASQTNRTAVISMTPYFNGTVIGQAYGPVPQGWASAGWTEYYDVTNDPGAPAGGWTWEDVANLDMRVVTVRPNSGRVHVARVEIRVSSAPSMWIFGGSSNTLPHNATDNYIRTITVEDVYRDGNGNIATAGTVDPDTKKVKSTVSWNFNAARPQNIDLVTYMTNWRKPVPLPPKGGMLAYADIATGANSILTKTFNASNDTWSLSSTLYPDGSSASSNALQVLRMYSSKTRNEKIIISRHSNSSTTQTNIYASVWNGTSWSKQPISTWAATSTNDFLNFDGTYLENGNFMVVYSDNSTRPKFRVWDGSSWSGPWDVGLTALTGVPNWVVVSQSPNTNQVMAVFLTASNRTQSYYHNGSSTYTPANWGVFTTHASATTDNTKRVIDFKFNLNMPSTGALIYATSSTDRGLTVRIFTASGSDGSGTGTWGTVRNGANQRNNLGAMSIESRSTANEFHACNKNSRATPIIFCNKITFSGSTPTVVARTTLTSATDTGKQRSFDIGWQSILDTTLLAVYSDNTNIPKYQTFDATSATWGSAIPITTTGTPGIFKSIRMIPQEDSDDIIVLMADANLDLFSIFWNGTSDTMYLTPVTKAYTGHGVDGVAPANFWYDFGWDRF